MSFRQELVSTLTEGWLCTASSVRTAFMQGSNKARQWAAVGNTSRQGSSSGSTLADKAAVVGAPVVLGLVHCVPAHLPALRRHPLSLLVFESEVIRLSRLIYTPHTVNSTQLWSRQLRQEYTSKVWWVATRQCLAGRNKAVSGGSLAKLTVSGKQGQTLASKVGYWQVECLLASPPKGRQAGW